MSLLKIAAKEIEKSKRPSEGWYRAEVVSVEEKLAKQKPDKPQGMNSVHTIRLVQAHNHSGNVNVEDLEKEKAVYIPLGEDVNRSFAFPYIEAVMDKPIEQLADYDLDLEKDFLHKNLYVKIRHDIYKKNPEDKGMDIWEFEEFRPISQVPF